MLGKLYKADDDLSPNFSRNFIINHISEQLVRLDQSKLSSTLKLRVFQLAFASLNRWLFTVNYFPISWIQENLQSMIIRYLKNGLDVHSQVRL